MASPTSNLDTGIMRSTRDIHPQHYSLRITRFSLLAEHQEKYESYPFEAGGYKWRLFLYPTGNLECFEMDHISLYLAIQDIDSFPKLWEVYVDFKVFVFDHIHNNYSVFQDLGVKRFHELKTVFGFDRLLPLGAFNDVSNGYLDDDSCIFGAEVFVIKPPAVSESIDSVRVPPGNRNMRMKIPRFSRLDRLVFSKEFTSQNCKWRLRLELEDYDSENEKYLSIFLELIDADKLGSKERIWLDFELCVRNGKECSALKNRDSKYFTADVGSNTYGWRKVQDVDYILNDKIGFIIDDSILVELVIMVVSLCKADS